jgi:hypothetical protein
LLVSLIVFCFEEVACEEDSRTETSATYQGRPGQQILATAVIPNAAIAPSLGRNLISCPAPAGACTSTASVSLIPPGTQYAARINQVDFRISKVVKLPQGRRVQGIVDIYNVFNGAPSSRRATRSERRGSVRRRFCRRGS